jgi:hypothetical protein
MLFWRGTLPVKIPYGIGVEGGRFGSPLPSEIFRSQFDRLPAPAACERIFHHER